jgi:hypothetical protein
VARSPLWSGPDLLAFEAREPADFDWMERTILEAARRPVTARFADVASRQEVARVTLASREPARVAVPITGPDLLLELTVDPSWVPAMVTAGTQDAREPGVAVRGVEVVRAKTARATDGGRPWGRALRRLLGWPGRG